MKNLRWQDGAVLDPPNISVEYRRVHTQTQEHTRRDFGANATRSTVHVVSPGEQASGMRGGRDRLPADLQGGRRTQAASRESILVRADGQSRARLVDGTQLRSPSLEREFAGQRPESTHRRKEQHRRRERCPAPIPSASERGPSCPVHGFRCNSRTPLRGSRCTGRNAPPTLRAALHRLTTASRPSSSCARRTEAKRHRRGKQPMGTAT